MKNQKCGARCPNADGGPDYICERPKHKGKHWQGGVFWTVGGSERIAKKLEAKESLKELVAKKVSEQ